MPFDFDGQKEDTNTIWGSRQERRRRDTFKEGTLKTLRGRRKGTLKVPGQVVSYISTKQNKTNFTGSSTTNTSYLISLFLT